MFLKGSSEVARNLAWDAWRVHIRARNWDYMYHFVTTFRQCAKMDHPHVCSSNTLTLDSGVLEVVVLVQARRFWTHVPLHNVNM